MSEGNLLDHQHHHQQQSQKLFCSSRDSELELLAASGRTPTPTTTTSSPEIRSRSQSVSSEARKEALLFFEQHRLFQNSPELDFAKGREYDCELRSISSCSRNSSPNPTSVVQQVKGLKKSGGLRQQSDSNLLDSDVREEQNELERNGSGRARSQSQGQCGSLRKKKGRRDCYEDEESSIIVINTTHKKTNGESGAGGTVKQKASKWLEEIQFTAQYQHYRTNNYASVVSSASSLDKSDGGAGVNTTGDTTTNKDAPEAERSRSSSKPTSSSSNNSSSSSAGSHRHRHLSHGVGGGASAKNQEEAEGAHLLNPEKDDLNRQNSITTEKCWNFPRVKLRKLFTAKSLDDILGGGSIRQSSGSRGVGAGGSGSGGSGRKSLQVAQIIAQEESSGGTSGISGERSSSSPEFVSRNTKKAHLFRDNKLSLPRIQQQEDGTQLLIVQPYRDRDGSKSPGAHSSKSAIVISTTSTHSPAAPSNKSKRVPTFIKATRQKSRSFSALTTSILSKVPGHSSVSNTSCNSPCSSTASSGSGLSFFTKRSHQQDGKGNPPAVPIKRKSGGDKSGIVPCAKSENCLNRFVASATCAKFADYFSSSQETTGQKSSKSSTVTLVEPFSKDSDQHYPGTPSSSSGAALSSSGHLQSISSSQVVTAQPRKWTAIKNKWDQKLQASGDRQKEIGASLASVSNNAQIFRKAHHQTRQRSNSLSPLDNPEDKKSIESLLEITSPSPTLQEVRFLDTPEIRYASPVAVRTSFYKPEYNIFRNNDDDDDEDDESEELTEKAVCASSPSSSSANLKGSSSSIISKIVGGSGGTKDNSPVSSRASSRCSSKCETESCCSECREEEENKESNPQEVDSKMTRQTGAGAGAVGGGTKRSRDHHHHHHHHHRKHHHDRNASKEKPKLVVANVSYLQRPQSPGLVLRESSPCSSTTSGTMDSFGNVVSGSGTDGQVIRNNNVFTNTNNNNQLQPSQQSKSQQAKLEFLNSFSPSSTPATGLQRRDPLSAKNTQPLSFINVNERKPIGTVGYSCAGGSFSSGAFSPPSSNFSSGGASSSRVGISTIVSPLQQRHQIQFHDDLQRRERAARAGTLDPLERRAADENNEELLARRRNRSCGAEQSSSGYASSGLDNQNQLSGDFSSYTHRGANLGLGHGGSSSQHGRRQKDEGERSSDNQSSGRDPGSGPGEGVDNQSRLSKEEDPSISINQGQRPLALAQQQSSINNNNLFIDVDFEGTEEDDAMGDLQSPQYVKRTAHMFDSRFSSAEHGTNGHNKNGRNPSYLNVSRSVSGYSCLAYNNGSTTSETVSNKSVLGNGASLLTTSRVTTTGPRHKTDFSLHSPFTRSNKVPNTDDDSSDHSSNQSATSPPPSLPPINTTSSRFSDSSTYFQNGMNRGSDELVDDTPYIPSHGKSFIMQRIERLYGSDAVQNKQILGRKSSNSSSHVTTISISRESPPRGAEHIIPIKVEPRDDHQNNLYNKKLESIKTGEERVIPISYSDGDKVTLPGIRGTNTTREENVRRIPIETRRSSSQMAHEDSDEELEESVKPPRARSKSPTKNLNGNANRYRNGVTASSPTSPPNENYSVKRNMVSPVERSRDANGSLEHANGNENKKIIGLEDCTVTKKSLSRESSAESDNSIELASIGSDENSKSISRKDSQDNSLYSNRGSTSPVKPKPKPKPKDMALLRSLSRSPASQKTSLDSNEKTASISNIVQPEIEKADNKVISEDQVDRAEHNSAAIMLADIKNTISSSANQPKDDKISPSVPTSIDNSNLTNDKENKHEENVSYKSEPTPVVTTSSSTVKDGNYFKNEMKRVAEDILRFSEKAAKELETLDPSDDRAGSIHAAIGKGNLLVKKKFKQFEGLCDANLKGATSDEPETTNEDLAGFWDMVLIQVDQIYSLFAELENKDHVDSPPRTPSKSTSVKRAPASTSKPTPKVGATPKANSAAAKARDEARRKLLAEKRRAMKNQMQQDQQEAITEGSQEAEVQIFAPDSTPQTG